MIEEIKNRLDLVEFISSYVQLKRAGAYYRGLCPFHQEKTPSFFVSPQRQIWKCFGCQTGGDVITFFMKIENLEFKEALKILAERLGLELSPYERERQQEKNKIFKLNQVAVKFYKEQLKVNQSAKEYLQRRGLTYKTIDDFDLGYAPSGSALRDFCLSLGYSLADLEVAGLINARKEDRFQARLIFPLVDHLGRVVGFTGRILEEQEGIAKYLNSPETAVFRKSRFIYGLHASISEIKTAKEAIVVEGQMDWLLAFQSGLKHIVALSGTALTDEQVKLLKRFTQKVVLAYDEDEAGIRATLRSAPLFLHYGFELEKLLIGGVKDLGEFFEAGYLIDELKRTSLFQYLFDLGLKKFSPKTVSGKRAMIEFFLPQLKLLNPAEAQFWLTQLSDQLNVAEELLRQELMKIPNDPLLISEMRVGSISAPQQFVGVEVENRFQLLLERCLALMLILNQRQLAVELKMYIDDQAEIGYAWSELIEKILQEQDDDEVELIRLRAEYEQTMAAVGSDSRQLEQELRVLMRELKREYYRQKLNSLKRSISSAQTDELNKMLAEAAVYSEKLKQLEKNG
jgi:DNA primase